MLVVHASWVTGGRLVVWGEDSALPVRPPRRPGRPPRQRPHPFAAGHAALAAALGAAARPAPRGNHALRLPTRGGAPADSPELVRTQAVDPARGSVDLATWQVPVLEYDADAALPFLDGDGTRDIVPGSDLRHLVELAGFAVDLVGRGRVLPTVLSAEAGAPQARWRPLLTAGDAAWARALALALPPAAGAADPEVTASALVADALDELTDAAARRALQGVRLIDARPRRGADAAVQGWLRALTGAERTFAAEPGAVADLAERLHAWQRDAAGSRIRACFRLVEPPAGDTTGGPDGSADTADSWRLDFALQSADEPSLLVGADRVWAARGGLRALARDLATPQETLLGELGRASRLWPPLEDALRAAAPDALDLDTEGAHQFLRDGAPLLHAAGFGVLLPSWWQRPGARLGARLKAHTRTAPATVATRSAIGLESLVDYEWELALGDQPLSAAELAALAKLKTPLVRLRGQWVELDPRRLAAGLKLLRSGGEMTLGDLLRLGLERLDDADALPVLDVVADGALGDLLAGQAERHLVPVDEPAGFRGALRPYQKRGVAWLSFLGSLGLGGILADDMGLGKTVQLLALLAANASGRPSLLVCPMSLVGNWQREAERFVPHLRIHVHHGAERPRGAEFSAAVAAADLVITTYAIAARDVLDLAEIDWNWLVVDEAQAIKNAATRQAGAVRSLPARHRVAVTGTPVENRLADLWSIMEFANPGLLGGATTFKQRYALPIERHADEEAAARLRQISGPFVLRRVKTDRSVIADLPEKLEMEVLCNLTAEQASLYQAVVDDMLARIEASEGIERRGLVLAAMTRLKQVCNHPAQLLRDGSALPGRSGKLARLEEVLDEVLAVGERALLFTQYAEFGAMVRAHLSARTGREVLYLHGGVGKAARDDMVGRFQAADGPPLFVLSLKAGGTGLNLTPANHVVHIDRWWNPAVEDQATDRAFRIGQRRAVQVRKFVCAGTVEEKISAMIADKRGLAARIVGNGEQWLTELSTSELRRLFALEAGAVVE
ncbi:MAG TPA: DEAD/DEAH box helicase [Micromonosporaceae bacterium]|nr:DEAD/DEAH box helicase [Micromonosporaceae bacterium]